MHTLRKRYGQVAIYIYSVIKVSYSKDEATPLTGRVTSPVTDLKSSRPFEQVGGLKSLDDQQLLVVFYNLDRLPFHFSGYFNASAIYRYALHLCL